MLLKKKKTNEKGTLNYMFNIIIANFDKYT